MTTSYLDLKAQIEALEKQAEAARKNELEAVIANMKFKISEYGISAEELGFAVKASAKIARFTNKTLAHQIAETATPKKSVAPKYAKADGTKTWSGRGISPKWITAYTEAGGKLEELLIVK